ncbi:cryptochrome/photolyase family protein [Tropicibacter naphthalenivorans]|uniref:Deoxyribodipyrimidine photo-lyase n=1 Tax=Tropicibacter naphthalenivorans TaxID=441103 RepID=A0A0P1GLT5_9RHOB|nr:deoxyribodipyrimidine photo-lyase [Tropicibacter naphthalenivorans]CUH76808.1 Deoxyribodipyrimidine photo-lyase [Tropicibacter naphthalenivorans]SMC62828.1 deoxyribodipyrimidine photo-lyase [Tropicibacter naphthalenivorans]
MSQAPVIVWVRRDLRLTDHAAFTQAAKSGAPVIPVFIRDALVDGLGAAPKWRLGLGVESFSKSLEDKGSRLILRAGPPREVLLELAKQVGASAVYWQRAYDPDSVERDTDVKSALKDAGVQAESFEGHLLFEPWTVETKQGGYYKVYSPFWRAVKDREVPAPLPAPSDLPAPDQWPVSDDLNDWGLGDAMRRGAAVVRPYVRLGEQAAQSRLGAFMASKVEAYKDQRDVPAEDGTSCLSENLAVGEISPSQMWHAGQRALEEGKAGAETFLKEIVWREFAYHLMWHSPRILTDNWREEWGAFPWNEDERRAEVKAWKQARTGIRFVDAGLREMYVTGRMHNRVRMIVGSYLTKHLLCHWKIGMKWFEDCLIDWDPASNAMGWQWVAGSGPDATPYFRVFNPVTQREKFDPDRAYVKRWIAEGQKNPGAEALSYFDAIPESWPMRAGDDYPDPIVSAKDGREAALNAYENKGF